MNRLLTAMNAHDLDAFVECFAPGYRSEQPAHPSRVFDGSHQVRENWRSVFAGVPDFRAELVVSSDTGAVEIGEWRWSGTHVDGSPFAMCGVTVMGIEDGRVVWGRMYMEPVDRDDVDIDQMCARRIDHRSDSGHRRVARPDSAPADCRPMQLAALTCR